MNPPYLEFTKEHCQVYTSEIILFKKYIQNTIKSANPSYAKIYTQEKKSIYQFFDVNDRRKKETQKQVSAKATENALFLTDIRQYTLGMLIVATYHLWERQIIKHLKLQLNLNKFNSETWGKMWGWEKIINIFKRFNTPYHILPEVAALNELRLVSNSIKHGDGNSYAELLKLKSDITHETNQETPKIFDEIPLLGISIYPTENHINKFTEAITGFWNYVNWETIGYIRPYFQVASALPRRFYP